MSTTAVTVSLAERARAAPELSRLFGVTAVLANAVQAPRLLVLVWAVDPYLASWLAAPLLGMFAAGLLGAFVVGRLRGVWAEEPPIEMLLSNPYSFRPALKFALLFAAVMVTAKAASQAAGEQAILAVSALAGLVDASAISLSVADMTDTGAVSIPTGAWAVLVAVAVNAAVKWGLAVVNGTRSYALWLGGGFITMLGSAVGLLVLALTWY